MAVVVLEKVKEMVVCVVEFRICGGINGVEEEEDDDNIL